jgi:hypothetical protein
MKNCWKTLGIGPTGDPEAIKQARRELIKTWHPDLAQTFLRRKLCDLRCAEINAAFDEAMDKAAVFGQSVTGAAYAATGTGYVPRPSYATSTAYAVGTAGYATGAAYTTGARYATGSGPAQSTLFDTKHIPDLDDSSFLRAFLSDPLMWLYAFTILIITHRIPFISVSVLTTPMIGLGSMLGVNFSRRMMRTCAPDQRANWLLLVVASATILLVSIYGISAQALGPSAAQIIAVVAFVVLPVWLLRIKF